MEINLNKKEIGIMEKVISKVDEIFLPFIHKNIDGTDIDEIIAQLAKAMKQLKITQEQLPIFKDYVRLKCQTAWYLPYDGVLDIPDVIDEYTMEDIMDIALNEINIKEQTVFICPHYKQMSDIEVLKSMNSLNESMIEFLQEKRDNIELGVQLYEQNEVLNYNMVRNYLYNENYNNPLNASQINLMEKAHNENYKIQEMMRVVLGKDRINNIISDPRIKIKKLRTRRV